MFDLVVYLPCEADCNCSRASPTEKLPGLNISLDDIMDYADQFLAMSSACALARIDPKCPVCAAKSVPVLIEALDELR